MSRKLSVILVALVAVLVAACGTVEDEVRQRADEEIDRQRERIEERVDEEINERSTQVEDRIEEEITNFSEGEQ